MSWKITSSLTNTQLTRKIRKLESQLSCLDKIVFYTGTDIAEADACEDTLYINRTTGTASYLDATGTLVPFSGGGGGAAYTFVEDGGDSNIVYFQEDGSTIFTFDFNTYLDDTNLARITSGVMDYDEEAITLTRDDASTIVISTTNFVTGLISVLDSRYVRPTDNTNFLGDITFSGTVTGISATAHLEEIPNTEFTVKSRPSVSEVRTWVDANLSATEKESAILYMIEDEQDVVISYSGSASVFLGNGGQPITLTNLNINGTDYTPDPGPYPHTTGAAALAAEIQSVLQTDAGLGYNVTVNSATSSATNLQITNDGTEPTALTLAITYNSFSTGTVANVTVNVSESTTINTLGSTAERPDHIWILNNDNIVTYHNREISEEGVAFIAPPTLIGEERFFAQVGNRNRPFRDLSDVLDYASNYDTICFLPGTHTNPSTRTIPSGIVLKDEGKVTLDFSFNLTGDAKAYMPGTILTSTITLNSVTDLDIHFNTYYRITFGTVTASSAQTEFNISGNRAEDLAVDGYFLNLAGSISGTAPRILVDVKDIVAQRVINVSQNGYYIVVNYERYKRPSTTESLYGMISLTSTYVGNFYCSMKGVEIDYLTNSGYKSFISYNFNTSGDLIRENVNIDFVFDKWRGTMNTGTGYRLIERPNTDESLDGTVRIKGKSMVGSIYGFSEFYQVGEQREVWDIDELDLEIAALGFDLNPAQATDFPADIGDSFLELKGNWRITGSSTLIDAGAPQNDTFIVQCTNFNLSLEGVFVYVSNTTITYGIVLINSLIYYPITTNPMFDGAAAGALEVTAFGSGTNNATAPTTLGTLTYLGEPMVVNSDLKFY